ncbi:DUF1885 family protein [Thermoflavimicrobium dichotomicum]|uniref:DUF1885 family protein n=1 Tax=Thermoflavimicrobium dichotomicum TaxID=46223 RepID=UPI001FE06852|nr:DUF1885 family protein [Thermoflavimicrobium dichotomicum]
MSKSAYIKLVDGSKQKEITLEDIRKLLDYYQEMTALTGKQLGWDYQQAAFPYTVEEKEQNGIRYLLLKGKEPSQYYYLLLGVGQEKETGIHYIQLVLPDRATHGDCAKANEYSRFLAKQLQAELHMLNGRIMYFNPRK